MSEEHKLIPTHIKECLEVIGSIFLIVELGFLGLQLKQNNNTIRVQTRATISDSLITVSMAFADKAISEAFSKPINELTPTECNQLYGFSRGMFRSWENLFYQHQQEYFDKREYEGALKTWKQLLKFDIFRMMWDYQKDQFAPEFKSALDIEVEKINRTSIPIEEIKKKTLNANEISLCYPQSKIH